LPLIGGRIGGHYELTPPVVPVRTSFCRSRNGFISAALAKALELAKTKDADYLPGWCGPSRRPS
jgi:hypothetical protein